MRFAVVGLALSVILFAGCADEAPPEGTDDEVAAPTDNVTVPEPLRFQGTLHSVATPVGETTGCGPTGAGCTSHGFTIDDNLTVTLSLTSKDGVVTGITAQVIWGTDYDLSLRDASGRELGTSTEPSGTVDVIELLLPPGSYTADVLSWNDQDGEYVLDISFALPPQPTPEAPDA